MRLINAPALSLMAGLCAATNAAASSFGVYDARALAMAGTSVAVGDINQAHHYNPSLIAFHRGHEDRTEDGRHSFALVANRVSNGAQAAAEAIADDLEGELTQAIDQLNSTPTAQAALVGIDAAQKLEQAMTDLKGKNIAADGYVGYAVTLPADREGGAFFVGSRIIGAGSSSIEDSDFQLLDDYVEALDYIASDGAEGAPHPELFNEQGQLYNPSTWIESSASGVAIAQTELGVSGAKQWQMWGVPVALGVAPKFVYLRSYSESWRTVEDNFDSNSDNQRSLYFNMDIGATMVFKQHYRVALAVKDVRSHSFTTSSGRIELKPRARLGLAYSRAALKVGMDYDLNTHNNLHSLEEQQMVSIGAEYQPFAPLKLRLGFEHDLQQPERDRTTAGVGLRLGGLETELAYSESSVGNGAALQVSFYH